MACPQILAQEKITDSHFWVVKEYPQKSQIWKSETSPSLGTWLGIPWLGLVSLSQIWDFYGYSLNTQKYPKLGIRYFFLCSTLIIGAQSKDFGAGLQMY